MKVSDWIRIHPAQPVTTTPVEPMEKVAAALLAHAGLRDLYVVTPEGHVLGNIRHRRLAQILLAEHLTMQTSHQIMERVSGGVTEEIMERDFVSAMPEEELDNVLSSMLAYDVEDMPVLDDTKKLVGNINLTDVLHAAQNGEL